MQWNHVKKMCWNKKESFLIKNTDRGSCSGLYSCLLYLIWGKWLKIELPPVSLQHMIIIALRGKRYVTEVIVYQSGRQVELRTEDIGGLS